MAHQRSTSSEESPPKTASHLYRGNSSGPRRVRRTSRKSTSENGMDLCMLHGECGRQTQVQQLRVQIPRWSARGLGREGQEKGQAAPSQAYVALRRLWQGQLFAAIVLLLVWSEASGVGCIFSSSAPQETTDFTAAKFGRGCGSGTTLISSYLADGVEVAGRERGDRCQDRRGFEPGQRQGQHQRDCQQAQVSGRPHSTASALRPLPSGGEEEREELKIQLQNCKPLHQRLRLATEDKAKDSKALEVAKREEAGIVELSASSVRRSISSRPRFSSPSSMSNCWS